jgi:hypothetical protein
MTGVASVTYRGLGRSFWKTVQHELKFGEKSLYSIYRKKIDSPLERNSKAASEKESKIRI